MAWTAADGPAWVQVADGAGATEWLEMGGEKKSLEISELGCADGCGREMGAENCADGVGAREWLEMDGEKKPLMSELGCADGCGREIGAESRDEGAWLRGRLRTGNGCREVRGRLRTAWVQGSRWKWVGNGGEKNSLVMSELGCADGCGRQMGGENGVNGCGRRGCKGVAGNGWGEEAAGDERAWLRGRLRTGNGCGEFHGRLRTAWV